MTVHHSEPAFLKSLTQLLGMWLVEIVVSTNHMLKICVSGFENNEHVATYYFELQSA